MPTVSVEAAFGAGVNDLDQFLALDGTSGTQASTPDAASLRVTGDIDIRVKVAPDAWSEPGAHFFRTLVGRWNPPSNLSWRFQIDRGRVSFVLTSDGTAATFTGAASNPVPFADGAAGWVRVTWRASDGRTQFFTSGNGMDWTQSAVDRILNIGAIHAGTADLVVGGPENRLEGKVLELAILSGIDGTPVVSPDFTETGPWQPGDDSSTSARDDGQSNPWSLEGSAEVETIWTDLTDRVGYPGGITWAVGRWTERDQGDAGTGSVTFDNSDRALDPTNEASPFWPHIRPMTRIRVRATHDMVTYPVLQAYARAWPPRWQGSQHGHVTVPLVDGFKLLATARTSVTYPEQSTGQRINALLNAVNWPADRRQVDDGRSPIQAYDASDRIVLNALRETATVESGTFFIGPQGDAIFRDRQGRIVADVQAVFGEEEPDVLYEDIDISYDDGEIWNDVAVKPEGLSVQRAVDEVSKAAYGHRWLERFNVLITTEGEALDRANWDLGRYSDPRLRIDRLHLRGDLFEETLEQVLALGIGDRITVTAQPAGGGDPINRDVFIEHVTHRIEADSWSTTWQLSPAFAEIVWLIGVPGFSNAGVSTRVGY